MAEAADKAVGVGGSDGGKRFDMRGFIENSLLEWEGKVASVVIAGGCNLRCPYCHSWRYVTGLDTLEPLDPEVLFSLLERQKGWIDGVVFTGGEPTLQPGLAAMLRRTKSYGVKTKLHSNGTNPEVLDALLKESLLDCLALDLKAPLDQRFFAAVGKDQDAALVAAVKASFRLAQLAGIEKEYHTTLSPAFLDLDSFAIMAERLEPDGLWILQQYENDDCLNPAAAGTERFSEEELERFEATAKKWHAKVLLKKGKSA